MSEFNVYKIRNAEESSKAYDIWAEEYEKDLVEKSKYMGPKQLAEFIARHLLDKNAKILDFGAGTGLLGAELVKQGFTNIDAHDGSEKMLEVASRKGVYKNFYQEICEPGKPVENIPVGVYDAVVDVGCISPGHLNTDHLPFFLIPAKKGGKIFIGVKAEFLQYETIKDVAPDWKYNVREGMKAMERENRWRLIEECLSENFIFDDKPGYYFAYEKCSD